MTDSVMFPLDVPASGVDTDKPFSLTRMVSAENGSAGSDPSRSDGVSVAGASKEEWSSSLDGDLNAEERLHLCLQDWNLLVVLRMAAEHRRCRRCRMVQHLLSGRTRCFIPARRTKVTEKQ